MKKKDNLGTSLSFKKNTRKLAESQKKKITIQIVFIIILINFWSSFMVSMLI